ncbi:MAG: hypothetical protein AABW91_02575 [Nanoarchaeota archaeon]
MNLRRIIYATFICPLIPIVFSGCGTLETLDNKVDEIFYKNEDWMNRGYSRHFTNQEYKKLRKERIKTTYGLPQ